MVTFLNEECRRWNLKDFGASSQWNRLEPTSEVDTEVFHFNELCPPVRENVEFLDISLSGYNLSRTSCPIFEKR